MQRPSGTNHSKRRRQWEASEQSSILNYFSKARPVHTSFSRPQRKQHKKKLGTPASSSAAATPAATGSPSLHRDISAPFVPQTRNHPSHPNCTPAPPAASQTKPPPPQQQQLYLDFGQRNFGQQIVCPICNMLYVHGVEEDLKEHETICKDYREGVAFHFKNCRVVQQPHPQPYKHSSSHPAAADQIVEIRPSDSCALRQKVAACQGIVDQELGFVAEPTTTPRPKTTFLYIRQKRILGLAAVEILHHAYPLVVGDEQQQQQRSNHPVQAMMGVYKLWTHSKARRQGVATRLIDAARQQMVYGILVPPSMVAFSSPTQAGTNFAQRYLVQKQRKGTKSRDDTSCDGNNKPILVYDF